MKMLKQSNANEKEKNIHGEKSFQIKWILTEAKR